MKNLSSIMVVMLLLLQAACTEKAKEEQNDKTAEAELVAGVKPVPLPDPGIPGFVFPEKEDTINSWIAQNDLKAMHQHSWGVWTALTSGTGDSIDNTEVLVYETWATAEEILSVIGQEKEKSFKLQDSRRKRRAPLKAPRQFLHNADHKKQLETLEATGVSQPTWVTVNFSPDAAQFIIDSGLFKQSKLTQLYNEGKTDVPDFPSSSIVIKPTYEIVPGPQRSKGLYQMKVWTESPSTPQPYGQDKWPGCVYVDINNNGQGNGQFDKNCKGAKPENTYNVNDFIHYTLSSEDAQASGIPGVQAGDIAILVCMHVTTREIKRWTWETYWWAPDADNPPFPSSKLVADDRPVQLTGAPRHYAMAIGYTFITPDQPFTGGTNKGTSLYVFNPYLEAGFGRNVFNEPATVITKGVAIQNNFGIRTNCMSCHAQASFSPSGKAPGYIGDTYIDMNDKKFKASIKVDFLWSIADLAVPDSAANASGDQQ